MWVLLVVALILLSYLILRKKKSYWNIENHGKTYFLSIDSRPDLHLELSGNKIIPVANSHYYRAGELESAKESLRKWIRKN